MIDEAISQITQELELTQRQVRATVALLDEGATVPFIARYRKEATGNLDEVLIVSIRDKLSKLQELWDRREAILHSLEERGLSTEELRKTILSAETMAAALEVINNDPGVRAIFINIFGGIVKGEVIAEGILGALERVDMSSPIVMRLDGTNAGEGRAMLEPKLSDMLMLADSMLDGARKAVELAGDAP